MRNAQKDDLFIDNCIHGKKNPFKNNNWVDFYHDDVCQDDRVSSIVMEETKLIA